MDASGTVYLIRDVVQSRRVGLPIPETVDLDALLEKAADTIESLEYELEEAEDTY